LDCSLLLVSDALRDVRIEHHFFVRGNFMKSPRLLEATNNSLPSMRPMAAALVITLFLCCTLSTVEAAIVPSGNVEPVETWTSSTTGYVGRTSNGSLIVNAGSAIQSYSAYIANNSGVSGTATVTGFGSKWTDTFDLYLGYRGSGTLRIEAHGQVSDSSGYLGYYSGSSGTATVTGFGSTWENTSLDVGYRGTGTLRIEASGQVSDSSGYLGYYSGSSGTATITGFGSTWENTFLDVGYSGTGTLRIEAGGRVTSTFGDLGTFPGSTGTATITGFGSKWTNSAVLYVGHYGKGTLTVADGGEVVAQTLYASLGNLFGNGTITAQGAVLDADLRFDTAYGSQTTLPFGSGGVLTVNATERGALGAGYKGNGNLNVVQGAVVASYVGYLGYLSGSCGTATVTGAGSKWTNNGPLYVGLNGAGILTVAEGGEVAAETLYASLGNLFGNGTITAQGAILDADLRFDAAHPVQNTFAFGLGGTLTVSAAGGDLGAGYTGIGRFTVAEGVSVTSSAGYLGYHSGSSGTATVTGSGSRWINNNDLYVGYEGVGTLCIEAGGQVNTSSYAYVGPTFGSSGTITVSGTGSKWTSGSLLEVGSGTLRIEAGGQVNNPAAYLGSRSGSSGTATVTGAGSVWTNSGILHVGSSGTGTLRIEAGGQVSSSSCSLGLNSGSSGSATITGAGSVWTNSGILHVGSSGTGTLRIEAGGQVSSSTVNLGYYSSSMGTATITGAGSVWTNSGILYVGSSGTGTLRIEAGGQVSSSTGYLGYYSSSMGTATITGAGSVWTNSGSLNIGNTYGNGTMHIRDGGMVTADSVSVYSKSVLTLDTSYGSNLRVGGGTGSVTNNGKIRVLCGPQPSVGNQYSPIAAGTWSGSGTYQALGGTWDNATQVFTVSQTVVGASGTPVAVDLAQQQRVLVDNPQTDWTVGASFLAKTGTQTILNLTASVVGGDRMTALKNLIAPGQSISEAWNLTASGTGYSSTDPVYLSFAVSQELSISDLNLWRFDGTTWSPFSAIDLSCNEGYASFTSTGLSTYAISAVPEPSTIALLGFGVVGLWSIWLYKK
jgi:fibronectin-binding autotransporter adhesin